MRERGRRRQQPYEQFLREDMILRDYLAADRTALANERTLLAYMRTAVGFGIGGASVRHFGEGVLLEAIGSVLIVIGLAMFAFGVRRFVWYRGRVSQIFRVTRREDPSTLPEPPRSESAAPATPPTPATDTPRPGPLA